MNSALGSATAFGGGSNSRRIFDEPLVHELRTAVPARSQIFLRCAFDDPANTEDLRLGHEFGDATALVRSDGLNAYGAFVPKFVGKYTRRHTPSKDTRGLIERSLLGVRKTRAENLRNG